MGLVSYGGIALRLWPLKSWAFSHRPTAYPQFYLQTIAALTPGLGLSRSATLAVIEKLAGVSRHFLGRLTPALGTGDGRFRDHGE